MGKVNEALQKATAPPVRASSDSATLTVLRKRPGWLDGVTSLKRLVTKNGDEARAAAREYSNVYAGRRGAMVFDVVASRQRKYRERVLPLVARWERETATPTLEGLASTPLPTDGYGLRQGEPATMQKLASNLLGFAKELDVPEDEACRVWADSVEGLEHAHNLDPIVGQVSGIGPALFAYMRMRSGANALKPDLRVIAGLRRLGFKVPGDAHSVLVVARAVAAEVDVDLLTLDQLLWSNE